MFKKMEANGKVEFEKTEKDPDFIRLTEKLIEQNNKILEINAQLLMVLWSPITFIAAEKEFE